MAGHAIDGLFVSHWHADHAGGLLDFPNATLYYPDESASFAQNALASWAPQRHGLLPGLFPSDAPGAIGSKSARARELGEPLRLPVERWPFLSPLAGLAKDPLRDGTLAAIDLPGHAVGHFGLIAESLIGGRPAILFFCSDAVWSERELESRWKLGLGACFGFHSWSKARMTREIIAETIAAARRCNLYESLYVLPAHCEPSAQRFLRAKRGLP
jgi:glyoxylase-like metal-dependent hydrolase (beta-lactamase superfamily II)